METYSSRLIQIEKYIEAYNAQDVEGMLRLLHPEIHFKNVTWGKVTTELQGKEAFQKQAESSLAYFEERSQEVTYVRLSPVSAEVSILFRAVLAQDFPNGLKAGETMELSGKSIFKFSEGLISDIEDIS